MARVPRLYIDVHILQTVPPANLNRDDQNNPKEAYYGGVRRSRVSSQSWKRATRKDFASRMPAEDRGTRTKRIAAELAERLATTGINEEQAERLATALLTPLGLHAGRKAGETAYLLFFGYRQLDGIVELLGRNARKLARLNDKDLADALKDLPVADQLNKGHPLDVALFGRMVADIPEINVDAAAQVAHALSTHAVEQEFDYYTAVDDENEKGETGAGMIGTIAFNSATLYRYATIALHQLHANLADTKAALHATGLFVDSFARSVPSGHQTTFAHRTLPSLVSVAVRTDQPVNLVSAFEKPVTTTHSIAEDSAIRFADEYDRVTQQWANPPAHVAICHTFGADTPAAARLAEAFPRPVTFPKLLTGLGTQLRSLTKATR